MTKAPCSLDGPNEQANQVIQGLYNLHKGFNNRYLTVAAATTEMNIISITMFLVGQVLTR